MPVISEEFRYFNSAVQTVLVIAPLHAGKVSGYANALAGTFASSLPRASAVSNLTGVESKSYYDLFYNKIHLVPEKLELGNVASSQTRTVLLWNAYKINKTLNAFTANNTNGMSIIEPKSPVATILPLEILEYIIKIEPSGEATVNATLNWTIDTDIFSLPITGNRISAFFYAHNWRYIFIETWSYLTSVIRKKDDTEQRARLRFKPRKNIKFNSIVSNNSQAGLNNILHGWHSRLFAVPLWSEQTETTTEVNIGEINLTIESDELSYHAGMLIAFYKTIDVFEMLEILTIIGKDIVLTNGTIYNWPVGTKIVAMNTARLNLNQTLSQHTDSVSQVSPFFECDPISTKTNYEGVAAPLIYNLKELWITKINWKSARKNASTALVDKVDSLTGGLRTFPLMSFSPQTKAHTYLLKDRAEIKLFKEFIERRKGKLKACYVPTYDNDFQPVSGITASSSTIDVKDNFYRDYVDEHGARKRLYLETYDGTYFTLEIIANTNLGNGTQRLSFSTSIANEIPLENIKLMSILMYARLVSDKVEFKYLSAGVAEVTLSFSAIKEHE